MIKTKYFCDVCEEELEENADKTKIQVIFTTEQTEGKGVEPYLSMQSIHICKKCMKKVCEGNYIWAYGAQGYNNYYFDK